VSTFTESTFVESVVGVGVELFTQATKNNAITAAVMIAFMFLFCLVS